MIVDQQTRNVESTMTGEAVRMSIAAGAEAHIMSVLTNLYEDPEAAIVREYSTNGYDAHIEAGVDRAIEVSTPTALSPFLKVRDYGCGLSVDDIHSIYSQYGASTKRGTNEQVGMLGLGCKSALTYADQFTLTSVKNGTRVVVVVGRDEDGAGTMTVMDTRATDEPEGTEVMIPAKRHNAIAHKAAEFFSYWPEGSVLLDGKQPKRFDGLKLTDSLYIVEKSGEDRVVMGNVAYPTTIDLGISRRFSLVAFVPIGSVTFPPAREALMDTAKTRATLEQIAADYKANIGGVIQREVDAAASPADALRVVIKWANYVPEASRKAAAYNYKGQSIPTTYVPAFPTSDPRGALRSDGSQVPVKAQSLRLRIDPNRYYGRQGARKIDTVPVHEWPVTLWLVNFVPAKLTKLHHDKAVMWCQQKGIDISELTQVVGDPTKGPASSFINPAFVLDWTEVRKVQLQPRQVNGRPARIPGSYDIYERVDFKRGVPGDSIDLAKPVFWINGNKWQGSRYAELLAAHISGKFTLVCLPFNRIEKFKRNVPQAKNWRDGLEEVAKAWAKGLTKRERQAMAMHDSIGGTSRIGFLRSLDPARVKDPAIKAAAKLADVNTDKLVKHRRSFERYLNMRDVSTETFTCPLVNYPLVASYRDTPCEHVYLYLNAAYEASK